jgi:hypothetical protein
VFGIPVLDDFWVFLEAKGLPPPTLKKTQKSSRTAISIKGECLEFRFWTISGSFLEPNASQTVTLLTSLYTIWGVQFHERGRVWAMEHNLRDSTLLTLTTLLGRDKVNLGINSYSPRPIRAFWHPPLKSPQLIEQWKMKPGKTAQIARGTSFLNWLTCSALDPDNTRRNQITSLSLDLVSRIEHHLAQASDRLQDRGEPRRTVFTLTKESAKELKNFDTEHINTFWTTFSDMVNTNLLGPGVNLTERWFTDQGLAANKNTISPFRMIQTPWRFRKLAEGDKGDWEDYTEEARVLHVTLATQGGSSMLDTIEIDEITSQLQDEDEYIHTFCKHLSRGVEPALRNSLKTKLRRKLPLLLYFLV